MKKYFLPLFLACVATHAQVIDLYNDYYDPVNGAYFQDITGVREQYVGTWLYTNGTTSLKFVFEKRDHLSVTNIYRSYFEDALVGEYQYIKGGVERLNTLNNLNVDYNNNYYAYRDNSGLFAQYYTKKRKCCPECLPDERRMMIDINEINPVTNQPTGYNALIRRFFDNGVEKLKVCVFIEPSMLVDPEDPHRFDVNNTIPVGEYILIKQ